MGIKFRALVGPLITISISTTAFTLLSRVMYKKSISPKFELDNIEGKIFVITGGCRGIGYYVIKHLLENNARVVIGCRNGAKCRENLKLLPNQHNIDHQKLDLDSFKSVNSFSDYIKKTYPSVDTLINNAATFQNSDITSRDGNSTTFQTNLYSPCLLSVNLLQSLKKSDNGHILNIGCRGNLMRKHVSVGYITGEWYLQNKTKYFLSKNVLLICTHKLSQLVKGDVRVNYIDPGHARTWLYLNGPVYWFLTIPAYFLMFSSAEEASISIINAISASKYRKTDDSFFIISQAASMPLDMTENSKHNDEVWSHVLKRIQTQEKEILGTIDHIF